MKTITIKNLVIQFDGKGKTNQVVSEATDMVEAINKVLQEQFPDAQPQIMETSIDNDDVEVEGGDDDEETEE